MNKHKGWKKATAFVLALALVAGSLPANAGEGGFFKSNGIVAHAIEDVAFNNQVSLTLGDDLALNFYADGINESNVGEYTVKFSGKCVEKESGFTVKNGKYCATTHIYAKNINENITATLYNGTAKIGDSITYSAARYLDALDQVTTNDETKQLVSASQLFGIASAEYFNGGDLGYADALSRYLTLIHKTEDDLIAESEKYAFPASDAMISLVLDSKTAIRVYIKDVPAGTEASGYTSVASTSDKASVGYPSYFEITGLTPKMLNKEYTIHVNDTDYTFSGLSWASRILSKASSSEKNIEVAKAFVAYFMAADEYATNVTNPATGISLDKSALTVAKGDTAALTATVTPADANNKTVTWETSNAAVATVSDGVVTTNDSGTAIITATNKRGQKAACVVTVQNLVDLSALTEEYIAQNGDVLTGTLGGNYKISVADGANIKLRDVTIAGSNDTDEDGNGLYNWAGITCNGDATLTLEGTNTVKGFYEDYPGVYIPEIRHSLSPAQEALMQAVMASVQASVLVMGYLAEIS